MTASRFRARTDQVAPVEAFEGVEAFEVVPALAPREGVEGSESFVHDTGTGEAFEAEGVEAEVEVIRRSMRSSRPSRAISSSAPAPLSAHWHPARASRSRAQIPWRQAKIFAIAESPRHQDWHRRRLLPPPPGLSPPGG